ncbi:MAG: hypothetical protein LBS59_09455 [Puniceicoccales bacterium]|jgi:hypothetical protein|nr:hypothetical protein [Puniceicoccales bacterium]
MNAADPTASARRKYAEVFFDKRGQTRTLRTTMSALVLRKTLLRLSALAVALATMSDVASAARVQIAGVKNPNIFGIRVNGTVQEFYGRADLVASISFQEYTTGALFVSEVDIDLVGGDKLLRIYSSRPYSADDAKRHADETAAAVGDVTNNAITPPSVPEIPPSIADAERKVQDAAKRATANLVLKTYPTVTHAKTVDFSVSSREELLSFYKNFRDLFCHRPLRARQNGTVVPASNTAASQEAGTLEFHRLGGALFTID